MKTVVYMIGGSHFDLRLATGLKVVDEETDEKGNHRVVLGGRLDDMAERSLNACPDVLGFVELHERKKR